MARKRTEFSPAAEARFVALMGQGWTAKAIADDLAASGVRVSRSTIDSRMREARGAVATPRAAAPPSFAQELAAVGGPPEEAPLAPESADLPTEADVEAAAVHGADAVAKTLERIVRLGRQAEAQENLPVVGRLLALELQARDLLRKLTPPERPDPNDAPDMVRLGAEVEERFHKMIDMVLEDFATP